MAPSFEFQLSEAPTCALRKALGQVQALKKSSPPCHLGLSALLGHLEPSVKGERQGEPTDQATPLPFRFPDAASWLNVAFSCAARNKAA